ncbi:MAG: DUF2029 domain-containing protein [Oligoflexia bacterium]|nr:DUF2029 domain-containing protein [Oligoflexia bacterium]
MSTSGGQTDSRESDLGLSLLGLFVAGLIFSLGTWRAFERGGADFSVFFEAWRLVLGGRGEDIYRVSPDRFLYAPGFAWLLAPVALLPRGLALALWCLAKAAVVGLVIRGLGSRLFRGSKLAAAGMAAWGVVLLARPFVIDLQYGQVNLFIMGACVWALLVHCDPRASRPATVLSWALLTFAALAKVFPLPLLLVPWLSTAGASPVKLRRERLSVILAAGVVLLLPLVSQELDGVLALYREWHGALLSKGLPLETHNQGFAAFLNRFFTAQPVHVIAAGPEGYFRFGWPLLSGATVALLSTAWTLLTMGALVAWLLAPGARPAATWIGVAVAALILPSHLIWKPYFVVFLPLAVVLVRRHLESWPVLVFIFAAVNFTGFDVLGPRLGAQFEAASVLLWVGLLMLASVLAGRHRLGR